MVCECARSSPLSACVCVALAGVIFHLALSSPLSCAATSQRIIKHIWPTHQRQRKRESYSNSHPINKFIFNTRKNKQLLGARVSGLFCEMRKQQHVRPHTKIGSVLIISGGFVRTFVSGSFVFFYLRRSLAADWGKTKQKPEAKVLSQPCV